VGINIIFRKYIEPCTNLKKNKFCRTTDIPSTNYMHTGTGHIINNETHLLGLQFVVGGGQMIDIQFDFVGLEDLATLGIFAGERVPSRSSPQLVHIPELVVVSGHVLAEEPT
jgi:hypothetical protein